MDSSIINCDTTDSNASESGEIVQKSSITNNELKEEKRFLTEMKIEPSFANFKKTQNNQLSTLLINLESDNSLCNEKKNQNKIINSRLKVNENSDNNVIYKLKTKFLFKTRLEKI